MLIKKIELKNFRQYIDTTIEFSTDKEKNVTLIMGDNGTGKTTLAQAFQWTLYGETSFLVQELINRKVREMMTLDGAKSMKSVSVTLNIEYNGKEYIIKRLVTYKRRTLSKVEQFGDAKFTISFVNENGKLEYIPDYQKTYFIKRILPKDLSKFFFFDGEKIEAMSKNIQEGKGREFKEAVYSLVGLEAMQNAIEHLQSTSYHKKSVIKTLKEDLEANSKSVQMLEKYNLAIKNIEKQLEEKNVEKDNLEREIKKLDEVIMECQKTILSETPKMQLKEEYVKLDQDLKKLLKKKTDFIAKDLLKDFKLGFYGFCMIPIMTNPAISELLEISAPEKKIVPGLTKKTIEYLLQRELCLCGTCLQKNTPTYKLVEEFLEYSYPKTIAMLKEDYLKTRKTVEKEGKEYFSNMQRRIKELSELNAQIEGKETELAEKMNQLANTDKGEEAKKQKQQNELLKNKKNDELVTIKADIKNLEKEKHRNEVEKEKLIIVDDNTVRAKRYLAYALEIYERMKKSYTDKENLYRAKLEEGMNEIFETIYDGNIKITIDEKYRIFVSIDEKFSSSDEIERNTAQSYALIFAFITAVIDLAKKKVNDDVLVKEDMIDIEKEGYPLVMDAPLSAFDITRIKSICTEIPRIADQVIMFIKDTDGNIAEQYMHEKIGKRYTAKKVDGSNLESQVLEDM